MKVCPHCQKPPVIRVCTTGVWTLECIRHGHMAFGANVKTAIRNWEIYVRYFERIMKKASML